MNTGFGRGANKNLRCLKLFRMIYKWMEEKKKYVGAVKQNETAVRIYTDIGLIKIL